MIVEVIAEEELSFIIAHLLAFQVQHLGFVLLLRFFVLFLRQQHLLLDCFLPVAAFLVQPISFALHQLHLLLQKAVQCFRFDVWNVLRVLLGVYIVVIEIDCFIISFHYD